MSALGIEIRPANQAAFVLLLGVVVAYILVAFLLYAWADLAGWRLTYALSQDSADKNLVAETEGAKATLETSYRRLREANTVLLNVATRLGSAVDIKMEGRWVSRKTSWMPGSMTPEDAEFLHGAMAA